MIPSNCALCGLPATGNTVNPGPALGLVHFSCFDDFDRRCEAEEMAEAGGFHVLGREPVREELRG